MHSVSFNQNLFLLAEKNPELASKVSLIDASTLPFSQREPGQYNVVDIGIGPSEFLFSTNPKMEMDRWWKSIENKDCGVLFIYGTGLGYPYQEAKEWLTEKPGRHIVFLEDDMRMLVRTLEIPENKEMFENPRVRFAGFIFEFKYFDDFNKMLEDLCWYYVLTTSEITGIPYYQERKPKRYQLLVKSFREHWMLTYHKAAFFEDLNLIRYRNVYRSYLRTSKNLGFDKLKNCFQNIPAIICGAGPSLKKHFPYLKELGNSALIFAGGSALPILDKQNIVPHFSAIIDSGPPYRQYFLQKLMEILFFYEAKASDTVLTMLHGNKIIVGNPTEFLPIEQRIRDAVEWDPTIKLTAYTVGEYTLHLAIELGCNPIILVGMDLAFTQDQYYAQGLQGAQKEEYKLIEKSDIYGNTIYTKGDWLNSAESIADAAKEHPEVTIWNCTEGGLGFEGVHNLPLSSAIEHIKTNYDLSSYVHTQLQQTSIIDFDQETVLEELRNILKNLKQCEALCKLIDTELEEIIKNWENKSPEQLDPDRGKCLVIQQNLKSQFCYTYFLDHFWYYFSRMLARFQDVLELKSNPITRKWRYRKYENDFFFQVLKNHIPILEKVLEKYN